MTTNALKLYLFGSPRIELDGRPITIRRRKALALLVYLAATRRPHSRDALATLFYPEHNQSRARTYFRRDLGEVNSELPDGWIEADNETAALGQLEQVWVDTAEFRQRIAANDKDKLSQLTAAVDLYVDDFMAGFSLPDCPEFDEWQFFEAETLRQALADVLGRLIEIHEGQGTYKEAIPFARRQVNLDPLNEPAQRQLMKLYALAGQQTAALRQYEICVELLEESLGVTPEDETTKLYETIKARRLVPEAVQPQASGQPIMAEIKSEQPIPAFLIGEPEPGTAPFQFVGRQQELATLQTALTSAQAGRGQIRLIIGEAGRGKSALMQAFARRAYENDPQLLVARGYCNAITGIGDPYLPFREILTMLTGDNNAWVKQLKALTSQSDAEIDQSQLFVQYTANLKTSAQKRPLLLLLEDLHWIDTASSGLLFHLSRELTGSPVLLIGSYRPEEILPSHSLAPILSELKRTHGDIWLDLGQQTAVQGREFIDAYLDSEPNQLGEEFRVALFEQTAGHALFTAELLRSMQERGEIQQDEAGVWVEGAAIDWQTLPARAEGVIESRIERLDEELQDILTTAGVEGPTFTAEVVARVQQMEERPLALKLSRELDKRHQLVEAQEVKWLAAGQQRLSTYRFRHNLFQSYLYHRLDEVERGYLHEAVGQTLEQIYQERVEEIAGHLAYHFQQAGIVSKAIAYSEKACETAVNVHAYDEAVFHISQAVRLAEQNGVDTEKLAALYTQLGSLLLITKGDGAPEVGRAYERAYELSKTGTQSRTQFRALRGLALFQRHRMETEKARQLTRDMCDLSQKLQDPALIIEASFALGSQSFFSGDHEEAQVNLERAINTYDPAVHQLLAQRNGQDPGVASLAYAAINDWMLGYPDRARDHFTRAIALATEIDHAYSLTMARNWASWTAVFLRQPNTVLEYSAEAIRLSEKHNFPLFLAIGTCHSGWALAQLGEKEAAIAKMERGLADAILAWGSELGAPPFLALLAEIYGRFDQPQEGLNTLDRAFTLIEQIKGRSWAESELYRLRGGLRTAVSQTAENSHPQIEADLRQAINIARAQSAKSLELRATINLAQLWQSQGKQAQARQMLGEIYGWFKEGFETADLQEARLLLESLS